MNGNQRNKGLRLNPGGACLRAAPWRIYVKGFLTGEGKKKRKKRVSNRKRFADGQLNNNNNLKKKGTGVGVVGWKGRGRQFNRKQEA